MTRAEAKQAYYDRVPVEVYITSIGWVEMQYIDQLIYSRPNNEYDNRNVPSDMSVRVKDKTERTVVICGLNQIRKVQL